MPDSSSSYFNPRTLDFKLGQEVSWKDSDQIQEGKVINITFSGLEVLSDHYQRFFITFDQVVS